MKRPLKSDETTLNRLQRLADGIFVLAMTLMVLQFDLPDLSETLNNQQVTQYLVAQLPALGIYLTTFVLIAFYWFENLQQLRHFRRTDTVHIWVSLLSLMFVVLVPYTNDLITVYDKNVPSLVVYSLNLLLVGLLSSAGWFYASQQNRLLSPQITAKEISTIRRESLVEPGLALLSIPAACISPVLWEATFWLLPVIYLIGYWLERRKLTLNPSDLGEKPNASDTA